MRDDDIDLLKIAEIWEANGFYERQEMTEGGYHLLMVGPRHLKAVIAALRRAAADSTSANKPGASSSEAAA